jgi:Recombination endonuclease VII
VFSKRLESFKMENKNCKKCNVEFVQPSQGRPKLYCSIQCRKRHNSTTNITKATKRAWYHSWRDKHPEKDKMSNVLCKVCGKEYNKVSGKQKYCSLECIENNAADRHYRKLYGISLVEYNAIKENQLGVCALCGKEAPSLHVDHCHESGNIRGLLCLVCNTRLGTMQAIMDDQSWYSSALQYIKKIMI